VAGQPLVNPLVGVLFLLGVAWSIHGTVVVMWSIVRGQEVHLGLTYPYILLLLLGMLVPVITTAEGMPHGLRSIGLITPLFLLAGTAGSVAVYWVRQRVGSDWGRAVLGGLGIGVLALSGLHGAALYFLIARNDPAAYAAYRGDLTVVADYIRQRPDRPYIVLDGFSLQTVHFLTSVAAHDHVVGDATHPDEAQHRWRQLDPARSHLTALQPGEVIIFTQSTLPDADRYFQQHSGMVLVEQRHNRFGQEIMRVYGRPAPATPSGEEPAGLDA
jgi:hypothetical protein